MFYKYSRYNVVIDKSKESVYLFNSYTGAFSELTNELYKKIYTNTNITSDVDFFDTLLEEGFIVPTLQNEYNKIIAHEKESMFKQNSETVTDVIALTLKCNMNCEYCFEAKANKNSSINIEMIPKIISFIKNQITTNPNLKNFGIQWFGGEPMLAYNYILQICDEIKPFCEKKDITFGSSIITNGLMLTKERANEMVNRCNLKSVQITLDGTKENYCKIKKVAPSSYEQVITNIADICSLSKSINLAIRLNASKTNIDDLKSVVDILFSKLNLQNKLTVYLAEIKDYTNCFQSDCTTNFKFGEYEIIKNDFYNYLKNKYGYYKERIVSKTRFSSSFCRLICASNALIGPNGELYKCDHCIGNNEAIIGNVADGYYYNDTYESYCGIHHFDKCKSCDIFPLCLSGCRSQQIIFQEDAVDCKGLKLSLINVLKNHYVKEE